MTANPTTPEWTSPLRRDRMASAPAEQSYRPSVQEADRIGRIAFLAAQDDESRKDAKNSERLWRNARIRALWGEVARAVMAALEPSQVQRELDALQQTHHNVCTELEQWEQGRHKRQLAAQQPLREEVERLKSRYTQDQASAERSIWAHQEANRKLTEENARLKAALSQPRVELTAGELGELGHVLGNIYWDVSPNLVPRWNRIARAAVDWLAARAGGGGKAKDALHHAQHGDMSADGKTCLLGECAVHYPEQPTPTEGRDAGPSTTCPTCGSRVRVRGEGTTHWYEPVAAAPAPSAAGDEAVDAEHFAIIGLVAQILAADDGDQMMPDEAAFRLARQQWSALGAVGRERWKGSAAAIVREARRTVAAPPSPSVDAGAAEKRTAEAIYALLSEVRPGRALTQEEKYGWVWAKVAVGKAIQKRFGLPCEGAQTEGGR